MGQPDKGSSLKTTLRAPTESQLWWPDVSYILIYSFNVDDYVSFIFNLNGVSVLVTVGFKLHTYRDARNLPHDSLEYSELKNGGLLNKDQLPAALGFLTVADAAKIQQQQPEVRNIFNIHNPHSIWPIT